MRVTPVRYPIYAIVAVFLLFSQPPAGASEQALRHLIQEVLPGATVTTPAFPDGLAGPSFYDDLLVEWRAAASGRAAPDLLIVIPHNTDQELIRAILRSGGNESHTGASVLFTAPRHDPADAGRVAAGLTEVPPSVPRLIVSRGNRTEWIVSVPGDVTPLWLVRIITALPDSPINEAQLNAARLGYGRRNPALEALLAAEVPAGHLSVENPEELHQVLIPFLEELERSRGISREPDRNYLMLPLPGLPMISEFWIVLGIVLLAFVLLLYSVLLPRRVLHYLRSMIRNWPAIVITLLAILVSLMAANLALRLVGRIPRISPPPLLLAGGKIAFGSLVLSILAFLLGHRIRHATAVYSGAAVLFLLLGSIISGAVSVILGAYFMVSFFFGVLFSLGHTAWIKTPALLLSVAPVLYLVIALAPVADQHMATALLTPPLLREVVTAVILLPILLMFFRLDSIVSGVPLVPVFAMAATVGLALTVASLIVMVRNPDPREVLLLDQFPAEPALLQESVPETGERVVTSGTGPLDQEVTLHIPGESLLVCPSLPCIRDIPAPAPPFTLDLDHSLVLDRHTIAWDIRYPDNAETVRIVLESDRPVQLYATDRATEQPTGSRGTRFVFVTGPEPPDHISGRVVLRSDTPGTRVTIRVTSRFPGYAAVTDPDFRLTHLGRTWTIRETALLE